MKRVQLDFDDETFKTIEDIQQKAGFSNRKELFDNALTLLQWAIDEANEGNKIGSYNNKESFTAILMPFLKRMKKSEV